MRALLIIPALLIATIAAAQGDPTTVEAKQHYQSGLAHFNLQEYGPAVDEFAAAYRLFPDPVFLFNLAQAHRLADNPERALYFYKAFLRARPDTPNRAEVQGRVADLERVLAAKQQMARPPDHTLAPPDKLAARAPDAAVVPEPAHPGVTPRPVDEAGGRRKRLAGLGVAGLGVAGLGVGIAFSVMAKQVSDQVTRGGAANQPFDASLDRRGRLDQQVGIAMLAVGGAALVSGAVLYGLGWRDNPRHRFALAPTFGRQQAGANALFTF